LLYISEINIGATVSRLETPFAGFCFQTVIFSLRSRSFVQLCKF